MSRVLHRPIKQFALYFCMWAFKTYVTCRNIVSWTATIVDNNLLNRHCFRLYLEFKGDQNIHQPIEGTIRNCENLIKLSRLVLLNIISLLKLLFLYIHCDASKYLKIKRLLVLWLLLFRVRWWQKGWIKGAFWGGRKIKRYLWMVIKTGGLSYRVEKIRVCWQVWLKMCYAQMYATVHVWISMKILQLNVIWINATLQMTFFLKICEIFGNVMKWFNFSQLGYGYHKSKKFVHFEGNLSKWRLLS